MTERLIKVGEAGTFRYIGIKPPLSEEYANDLLDQIELPYTALSGSFARTINSEGSEPFTEMGFEAGVYLDSIGTIEVDDRVWKAAREIGRILIASGDTVTYIDGIVQEGISLF
jgi:hypothetical protein